MGSWHRSPPGDTGRVGVSRAIAVLAGTRRAPGRARRSLPAPWRMRASPWSESAWIRAAEPGCQYLTMPDCQTLRAGASGVAAVRLLSGLPTLLAAPRAAFICWSAASTRAASVNGARPKAAERALLLRWCLGHALGGLLRRLGDLAHGLADLAGGLRARRARLGGGFGPASVGLFEPGSCGSLSLLRSPMSRPSSGADCRPAAGRRPETAARWHRPPG